MDKRGIRTPKQIAHSRKFTQRFAFGVGFKDPKSVEPLEKFDCTNCGDPTHGSYHGAIMSNMCWKCTTEYNRDYDEWIEILNLKIREDY